MFFKNGHGPPTTCLKILRSLFDTKKFIQHFAFSIPPIKRQKFVKKTTPLQTPRVGCEPTQEGT